MRRISIGKQDVNVVVFRDGLFKRSYISRRVVYRRANGIHEVNHLGGRKEIMRFSDGQFHQRLDSFTVAKTSLSCRAITS